MKLYFMIGLPTETDEDVAGIVETAARVQAIGRKHQKGAQVTASVSTHVPKPHTPFQWAAMDDEATTARKQALLAERARALRVQLKMHENQQSHIEGIFARGDRRAGELLEAAYRLGCRFDSWDDAVRFDLWEQAVANTSPVTGFDVSRPLGTLPVTARLPWSHIDIGLEPDFLAKEYRKALKDRLSPPCGKPYKKLLHPSSVAAAEAGAKDKLICYDCGIACDLDQMKSERLFFLRRMNAWGGEVTGKPAAAEAEAPGKPRPVQDPTRPPPRAVQGTPHAYRIRYTKLGRVAYLGHLDLVRHLPRIFRRAGFEIFYSIGFHPKPDLSFGPALGLGIPSLGEILDVKLVDDLPAEEVARRLRRVSLEGIEILEVARVGEGDRALGRVITESETIARLPAGVDASTGLARLAGDEPLVVRRESQKENAGIARTVDVRRTLRTLALREDAEVRRRLGWTEGALISFSVSVSHEGSARPIEVLTALYGADVAVQTDLARLALWGDDRTDPLRVAELRRRAAGVREVAAAAAP
jgi:radical SAM-linked protein